MSSMSDVSKQALIRSISLMSSSAFAAIDIAYHLIAISCKVSLLGMGYVIEGITFSTFNIVQKLHNHDINYPTLVIHLQKIKSLFKIMFVSSVYGLYDPTGNAGWHKNLGFGSKVNQDYATAKLALLYVGALAALSLTGFSLYRLGVRKTPLPNTLQIPRTLGEVNPPSQVPDSTPATLDKVQVVQNEKFTIEKSLGARLNQFKLPLARYSRAFSIVLNIEIGIGITQWANSHLRKLNDKKEKIDADVLKTQQTFLKILRSVAGIATVLFFAMNTWNAVDLYRKNFNQFIYLPFDLGCLFSLVIMSKIAQKVTSWNGGATGPRHHQFNSLNGS